MSFATLAALETARGERERAVRVRATDGSGIVIRLTAHKGESIISSLHLRRR